MILPILSGFFFPLPDPPLPPLPLLSIPAAAAAPYCGPRPSVLYPPYPLPLLDAGGGVHGASCIRSRPPPGERLPLSSLPELLRRRRDPRLLTTMLVVVEALCWLLLLRWWWSMSKRGWWTSGDAGNWLESVNGGLERLEIVFGTSWRYWVVVKQAKIQLSNTLSDTLRHSFYLTQVPESRWRHFEFSTSPPTISCPPTSTDDISTTTSPYRLKFTHRRDGLPEKCCPPSFSPQLLTNPRRRRLNLPQRRPSLPTNNVTGTARDPCPVLLWVLTARMCNGEMGDDVVSEKQGVEFLLIKYGMLALGGPTFSMSWRPGETRRLASQGIMYTPSNPTNDGTHSAPDSFSVFAEIGRAAHTASRWDASPLNAPVFRFLAPRETRQVKSAYMHRPPAKDDERRIPRHARPT
ncbi:hypothetical protein SCHPADRAFT_938572 [Schizopora paradoxa]|uniref:Uncharacterized protein n=1 Tax=Schizopora paradoxa TaxID=27342 RepID=A0A0H2RU92_9AGAM|nr:hypothetical protein SCHPADRAFT_938572 [Schizopora paradoxa]